jgi:competence protein ComGC
MNCGYLFIYLFTYLFIYLLIYLFIHSFFILLVVIIQDESKVRKRVKKASIKVLRKACRQQRTCMSLDMKKVSSVFAKCSIQWD